ncbi:hypothetical protein [Aeromicrobium sp.]|uniref:hypothetical protein n=1 Tax=Aeromicrobium sp. TaxID=1871063 RepID=UPI003C44F1F8
MRIATAVFLLAALTACGPLDGGSDEPTPSPSASSSTPSAAETNPVPAAAADLVGDWEDPAEKWTVHFRDDDTFVEDYQGVKDFRVGKYSIADGTVKLEGDDGNTDEGTVEGETLVFKLGTLKRADSSSGQ